MKKILFILLFALSISALAKGLPKDYKITASAEDKTLTKTKAKFIFTFKSNGFPIQREIDLSYNGTEKKLNTDSMGNVILNVKPGSYVFMFYIHDHFEVTTDSIIIKPGYITDIEVNFRYSAKPTPMKKPVIYVYPAKKENVCIDLDLKGNFSFTYPEYKNGWNFTAHPDGTIEMNDKKYHYLFWDGNVNIDKNKLNLNEGFIVKKNELISFFEDNLKLMGLNSQEIQDYITYWCPIMNVNESNYIHFMFNEECNNYAKMNIIPKPDHTFRVYMLWSNAKEHTPVLKQMIKTFNRSGFTVVEWGGSEIKDEDNF